MAITVDYDDLKTSNVMPVLTGVSNQELCDVEATVRVNAVTGGPDDVFTTKAIGGQWAVATEPLVRATYKPFVTSGGTPTENTYLDICWIDRLANGDMCCFFRKGGDHATNDGRIFFSTSSDEGVTWAAETLVYDSPTGYDTRNQAGGVDPDTGEIFIFISIYDAVGVSREDIGVISSTDNGVTWGTFTSLISEFPAPEQVDKNVVPFGKVVKTSNGLMMMFYYHEDAWCLFNNGSGWTGLVTVWTGASPVNGQGEPSPVAIDDNRIVAIVRDNVNLASYRYTKSSDGGSTWDAISDPYPWTSAAMTASAPVNPILHRGQVMATITGRNPDWELHSCRLSAEDFWDRPYMLWSDQNIFRQDGLYSATATNVLDWGYSVVHPIEGSPDTALVSFYDDDGATSETSIYMRLFPVV